MPRPKPIGDEDRAQVARLHGEGLSRNEIARRIGRSGRTVSRLAKELGLTFERGEQVQAATQAKVIDAKARRAALALALLEDAERLRKSLWESCTVYNFGGKDNTFNQALIAQPSFRDQRDIMMAVSVAAERSMKLDEYDRNTGVEDDKAMLVDLAAKLGAAWQAGKAHAEQTEQP
ncbi:hypothetical protein GCM10009557_06040 [Virgisporangium ochraceum]|uniref:Transposase IS30-like HTH domain-containing protein n=1 Tax=Virgisporangium ochraceum TaxID=65505 RepID=A0A8J3ZRP0_9ACTN|nr:helix-turn-helix domain-containing protein [Virgisporangium ochraceum]GIJ66261.1 hypothetical protein Voc01_011780 [Virgisporangium ochraceum]